MDGVRDVYQKTDAGPWSSANRRVDLDARHLRGPEAWRQEPKLDYVADVNDDDGPIFVPGSVRHLHREVVRVLGGEIEVVRSEDAAGCAVDVKGQRVEFKGTLRFQLFDGQREL